MKLTLDLNEEWCYEESIATGIREAIEGEIGREVRKMVKLAVEENRAAIVALANAYAKRMVAEAQKALG